MQTISSDEIDYLAASFRAWCKANAVTTPDADAALLANLPNANLEANIQAVVPPLKSTRQKHLVCVYK